MIVYDGYKAKGSKRSLKLHDGLKGVLNPYFLDIKANPFKTGLDYLSKR